MEKWQKIEAIINRILGQIFALVASLTSKITPAKFKSAKQRKQAPGPSKFKEKFLAYQTALTNWALKRKQGVQKVASNSQGYAISIVLKARSIKLSSFKPHGMLLAIAALFTPIFLKIKSWVVTLKPTTIALSISSFAIFSLAGLQIYQNSKEIADESGMITKVELVEELEKAGEISRRPANHGKIRQILTVTNLNMPVYLGKSTDLSSVILDFTIITTNRTTRNFLFENEILIRDQLTNSVHPTLPEFTLTTEGKEIIKQKIKDDLNALIKKLDQSEEYQDLIKDEALGIEDVYVDALLAN